MWYHCRECHRKFQESEGCPFCGSGNIEEEYCGDF